MRDELNWWEWNERGERLDISKKDKGNRWSGGPSFTCHSNSSLLQRAIGPFAPSLCKYFPLFSCHFYLAAPHLFLSVFTLQICALNFYAHNQTNPTMYQANLYNFAHFGFIHACRSTEDIWMFIHILLYKKAVYVKWWDLHRKSHVCMNSPWISPNARLYLRISLVIKPVLWGYWP